MEALICGLCSVARTGKGVGGCRLMFLLWQPVAMLGVDCMLEQPCCWFAAAHML